MANLLKQSKRSKLLPRVTDGVASPGERYAPWPEGSTADTPFPPLMFTLDVWAGANDDRVEYQLQLTEDEMIHATGQWLQKLATRRAKAKGR
jgi:hypothetical protein